MLQTFLMSKDLDDVLLILSIAFMPSVIGLLCAFFALGLPDDSKGDLRRDRDPVASS